MLIVTQLTSFEEARLILGIRLKDNLDLSVLVERKLKIHRVMRFMIGDLKITVLSNCLFFIYVNGE